MVTDGCRTEAEQRSDENWTNVGQNDKAQDARA
jgi:hypothetical protein